MRLKFFSAPTREEAMKLAHLAMGPDAVILSEREGEDGYEVRAAIERSFGRDAPAPEFRSRPRPQLVVNRYREKLKDLLVWHGAPAGFADVLASTGVKLTGANEDPLAAFTASLEGTIGFSPIAAPIPRPVMLVGPPGAGKTSTTAKLVRRAAAVDVAAVPMVADFDATGGAAQLAAYLHRKPEDLSVFLSPDRLMDAFTSMAKGRTAVIDTPPINPCDEEDLRLLGDLIRLIDAEPVLVLSAEGHPDDLEDTARAFADLGVKRCILTKLDVVRRRGGALCALSSARISLSHLALTPYIGGGLVPATPNRLARLLLDTAPNADSLKGAA